MASTSNQKSSSSASRSPKPTFRRAGGARPRSAPRPQFGKGAAPDDLAPARKPITSYNAPTKRRTASRAKASVRSRAAASRSPLSGPMQPAARGVRPAMRTAAPARRIVAPRPAPSRRAGAPSKPKGPGLLGGLLGGRRAGAPKTKQGAPGAQGPNVRVPAAAQPAGPKPRIAVPKPAAAGLKAKAGAPRPRPSAFKPFKAGKPKVPGAPRKRGVPAPAAAAFAALASVFARIPHPELGRKAVAGIAAGAAALAVAVLVFINSGLFAATDIQIRGTEHVSQQTAEQLIKVPAGTSMFNLNKSKIAESLQANPWVSGVDIEREWPHTLIITPHERTLTALAYITADDIAWAIGDDGHWIAPISLTIAVDAEGKPVDIGSDGSVPEGATQLTGVDAARAVAARDGALLLTDVPTDVKPASGEEVTSKVIVAGLKYAEGFSKEFLATVKDLSVASVEAISANLTSGVEVSLGSPENITEKERVVTKLLSQEQGVTYINVREPGAYTFRQAPAAG